MQKLCNVGLIKMFSGYIFSSIRSTRMTDVVKRPRVSLLKYFDAELRALTRTFSLRSVLSRVADTHAPAEQISLKFYS